MHLLISTAGNVRCIYNEAIPLQELGSISIQRASHVEPDSSGQWIADLSPVAGPVLGPFAIRSEALAAETAWLEQHLI